jgi:hypothetical protein
MSAYQSGFDEIADRLAAEFAEVHPAQTVSRCVAAAHHGAFEITGSAPVALVERIARKHLRVLAAVAAEPGRRGPAQTGREPAKGDTRNAPG